MSAAEVWLHSHKVGLLERFDDEGWETHRLSFERSWWHAIERPVLGQIFEDRAPQPILTSGPISWFAHLLPQGPLRRAIAREAGIEEDDVFALLSHLGSDLPGAVELKPGLSPVRPLVGALRPVGPDGEAGRLRFSLAGHQWKLSLRTGDRLTIPLLGNTGDSIGKLPSPEFPQLPRVEFATMQWAQRAGLKTPDHELVPLDRIDVPEGAPQHEQSALVVRRFDRTPVGRVHIEDFAQVLDVPPGPSIYRAKVEHIAAVLQEICPDDLEQLVAQLVFCVVAGNGDAHLKNWSLIYPNGYTPRLSPSYDLVATVLYPRVDDEFAMSVGDHRRFDAIDLTGFTGLAKVCQLDFAQVAGWVREWVQRTMSALDVDLGFTAQELRRIRKHQKRVPLCRG